MISRPTIAPADGTESGVSEVIGVVFLIGIVTVAVAVVAVLLFSQSLPTGIPNVNFMTGSDSNNNLYLTHNGGDSLAKGSFYVIVDGVRHDDYTISDGGTQWSLGKNLIISNIPSTSLHSVGVVYNQSGSGGGAIVLRTVNTTNLAIINNTVSPDVVAIATYPPKVSVPQLMQNITNYSIDYYRENATYISSGYIQFNVTAINSTLYTTSNTVPVQLVPGDVVKILPANSSAPPSYGFRVFGMGDQIWEINGEKVDMSITNRSTPLVYLGIPLNHTWITGYKDFQSTLTISTSPGHEYFTELAVNNYPSYAASQTFYSQIINGTSTKTIVISNIRPIRMGTFLLIYDRTRNSTYFAGNASYSVT